MEVVWQKGPTHTHTHTHTPPPPPHPSTPKKTLGPVTLPQCGGLNGLSHRKQTGKGSGDQGWWGWPESCPTHRGPGRDQQPACMMPDGAQGVPWSP